MADLEDGKQLVLDFFKMAFVDKQPEEAAAAYIGPRYIQHNPQVPDGVEGFIQFANGFTAQFPQLKVELKRLVAEGDLVVMHSHMTVSPEDRGTAVVDFFRLEDGKIVEHWDVLQPIPETAAHDNTMF